MSMTWTMPFDWPTSAWTTVEVPPLSSVMTQVLFGPAATFSVSPSTVVRVAVPPPACACAAMSAAVRRSGTT